MKHYPMKFWSFSLEKYTVSSNNKMILLPFARLLIIWKMEMGRERTRYPLTMEFAITKNLFNFQQKQLVLITIWISMLILWFLTWKLEDHHIRPWNGWIEWRRGVSHLLYPWQWRFPECPWEQPVWKWSRGWILLCSRRPSPWPPLTPPQSLPQYQILASFFIFNAYTRIQLELMSWKHGQEKTIYTHLIKHRHSNQSFVY